VNESAIAAAQAGVFSLIVPEMLLALAACILFVGSTFRASRQLWGSVALVALFAAGLALWYTAANVPTVEAHREALKQQELALLAVPRDRQPEAAVQALFDGRHEVDAQQFSSAILWTRIALLTRLIALVGGIVLVLFSWNEVSDRLAADYHACLLLLVAGLSLTGLANDLVTLFLALELISIPTYVILYLQRTDRPAQEAAAKYFLLSIFSSALLLFGFSYLYGLSGTTNIPALLNALMPSGGAAMQKPTQLLGLVAVVMVVAGLGFKITAVPFHFYAPDVYQGASTSAAGILAFVPKAAGFVALLRVLGFICWPALPADFAPAPLPGLALGLRVPTVLFWILATITMCVGNVLALLQDNVKRLLAYSSVAHAGYMLIGLAAAPGLSLTTDKEVTTGAEAVLFYLVAYGAMTLGAFAVIAYLSTPERPVETVDDLAGLSSSHPGVALLMALFMFSLIGIPLTAGFAGKLMLFMSALAAGAVEPSADAKRFEDYAIMLRWLVLIGAINAAVAGWYYLRIVTAMYLRTPLKAIEKARAWPGLAALWICAAVTLVLGIYPWPMVKAARKASLFPDRVAERAVQAP
jgi:NADH-quinone oxidoreductase subunit N